MTPEILEDVHACAHDRWARLTALYADDYQLLLLERHRRLRLYPGTRRKTDPPPEKRKTWPPPWKFRTDLGPVYREIGRRP
jgi:hypothetical protein